MMSVKAFRVNLVNMATISTHLNGGKKHVEIDKAGNKVL
jgi:hypothetical protein